MPSLNKVTLIGHAGRDGEMRYTNSGTAQGSFSVATSESRKNKEGKWEEETEWWNVIVWSDQAERVIPKVTKGTLVYIEGRLKTRKWKDDKGQEHSRPELNADRVLVLEKKEGFDE